MSDRAFDEFKKAREDQLYSNYARTIRTKVKAAREAPRDSGRRWPFELLQNAIDAGPREGQTGVSVEVGWEGDSARPRMTFRHNGAPFTPRDLAALSSGGSNKDFESTETTGRFGTGFLVTHVLSPFTEIVGLLVSDSGPERFSVRLDRHGDENEIIANALACEEQIRNAEPVDSVDETVWSAEFQYETDDSEAMKVGIETFRSSLAHMFSTCKKLRCARVKLTSGAWELWQATDPNTYSLDEGLAQERVVTVTFASASVARELRCIRVTSGATARGAALLVVERDKVRLLEEGDARAYRRFPLRRTGALPLAVAIDGSYDVDQERTVIQLSEGAREVVAEALEGVAIAVRHAVTQGWRDAHRLARVYAPSHDAFTEEDRDWWLASLGCLANRLANMPLVRTARGLLPAQGSDETADFPVPRLLAGDTGGVDLALAHAVMKGVSHFLPADLTIAAEWTSIAEGWGALGVETNLKTIEDVANHVSEHSATWAELVDVEEPSIWLLQLMDLVGRCWAARNGTRTAALNGLVPDQTGALRSPGELALDDGIGEDLKDAAEAIGIAIRTRLVHGDISSAARDAGAWTHLSSVIQQIAPTTLTHEGVADDCIKRLAAELPDGPVPLGKRALIAAAASLERVLWRTRGAGAATRLQALPLLASDGTATRGGPSRRLMMPPSHWDERARRFTAAYPPGRVLDPGLYSDDEMAALLVEGGIAWKDPLIRHTPAELKDRRLEAMADPCADTKGAAVSGQEFSYVALLNPEIVGLAGTRPAAAKGLLGLILCYVVRADPSWDVWTPVSVRSGRSDITIPLRGALWAGDLIAFQWVPEEDDEEMRTARASAGSLGRAHLLEPEWLSGNDEGVRFLTQCFGYDLLDLRLLGAAGGDAGVEASLRRELANVVAASAGDPAVIADVTEALEQRRRRGEAVQVLRKVGFAIQAAVKAALHDEGFAEDDVEHIDRGFDFLVRVTEAPEASGEVGVRVIVGRYFVEVKSTNRDEVAMTPLQARTAGAEAQCYALCVVPVDGVDVAELSVEDQIALVRDRARFVTDIGLEAGGTAALVDQARKRPVSLRNEEKLRYAVPESRWTTGLALDQWVASIISTHLDVPEAARVSPDPAEDRNVAAAPPGTD